MATREKQLKETQKPGNDRLVEISHLYDKYIIDKNVLKINDEKSIKKKYSWKKYFSVMINIIQKYHKKYHTYTTGASKLAFVRKHANSVIFDTVKISMHIRLEWIENYVI